MTDAWVRLRAGGWFAGALLILLHLLLALLLFDPTPFMGGDNAVYISLARALVEHRGYVDLYDPAMPLHTQFPPVFPAMIALGMVFGIGSLLGFKLMVVACSAGAVAFSYAWLRGRTDPKTALAVTALLAVSPGVADLAHWVLSDVPFWMLSMLALWQWERYASGKNASLYVAIIATTLAFFTRAAGLPLVLAAGLWLLSRRQWKPLALFMLVLAPLALLWTARGSGSPYASAFWFVNPYFPDAGTAGILDILQRVPLNLARYADMHSPILQFGRVNEAVRFIGAAMLGLAFAGWALPRPRPMVADLFMPLYITLLVVWPPMWSGERLLLPVLPLLLLYSVQGYKALIPPRFHFAALLMVLLIGLQIGYASVHLADTTRCNRRASAGEVYACKPGVERDMLRAARWARGGLPDSAAVVSRKPSIFWLTSGRQGQMFPLSSEPADLLARADSAGARYLVLDGRDRLSVVYMFSAVRAAPHAFCVVRIFDGTSILGILSHADRAARAGATALRSCPADFVAKRAPAARQPGTARH